MTAQEVRDAIVEIRELAATDPETAKVCAEDLWYRVLDSIADCTTLAEDQAEVSRLITDFFCGPGRLP
jgi:hypothetical protein